MIKLNSLRYNGKDSGISDLSFHLPVGEAIAICGANGCGKSTLFQIITGADTQYEGEVLIFDKDCVTLNEAERQEIALVDPSISFYKNSKTALSLARELEYLYIRFDKKLYFYYLKALSVPTDTTIFNFSISEYEKLLFAIALSRYPKVLLIDEAFDGLDFENKEKIFIELNKFLSKGGSILLATHDLNDVDRLCDQILIIQRNQTSIAICKDDFKDNYDVIELRKSGVETVNPDAIIYLKEEKYHYTALVKKRLIDTSFLNKRTTFSDIIQLFMEHQRSKNELR